MGRAGLAWPAHRGAEGQRRGILPPLHPTQYFLPLRPCVVATHSPVLVVSCSFSQAELKGLELPEPHVALWVLPTGRAGASLCSEQRMASKPDVIALLYFFFPSQKRLSDDVKFFTPIVLHWVCVPITLLLSPSSPSFLVDKASFTHAFAILCLF